MKMLVSDYDGTIKRFRNEPNIIQNIDLKQDLRYIKKFIEEGNLFAISSKRTIASLKKEIEKYKICYNYLTTYGGLVTVDENDKLIHAEYINKEILNSIKELSKSTDLLQNIVGYDEFGNRKEELKDELILIGISVRNIRNIMEFFRSLNIDLSKYHFSYDNYNIWIHNIINKNIGIEKLLKQMNNKPKEIITVGNSLHDLEMINEYDGWCIRKSELDVNNNEIMNVTPNIRTIIKVIK